MFKNQRERIAERRDAWLADMGDEEAAVRQAERNPSWTLGEIYRGEWNNWVDQFLPVDRKLMDIAGKQSDNRLAEENAKYGTQFAFNRAREADEMSRRGLGTSLSSEESQYLSRNSSLAEAAAAAKNINQTRLHTADRDKAIMSGGLTGGLRDLTNKTG